MSVSALSRFMVFLALVALSGVCFAQDTPAADVQASASSPAPERLTLDMMLKSGGPVLWVIILLSIVALIMGIYFFVTITPTREAPADLARRARTQVENGAIREAFQMCQEREELLARVFRAGLKKAGHDRYVIQEAMESEGERGATLLWQRISYLNNIGVIAPLLGLLGTVWGMIQAFSSIALDDAQVKGLNMAYYVSQAMITTAAGLVLAIPALVAYFYLRGRVVKIIAEVEAHASEFMELLARDQG